jgi:hypothetical protein
MTIQRPRWLQAPATPEERPAETGERPCALPQVKAHRDRDPNWPWPRTLRLAILLSGAFWLVVGFCVWAYLRAG